MKKSAVDWKLVIGLCISAIFMYLAFRDVDFGKMLHAFTSVKYGYLVPVLVIIFCSHFLRALRWRYLLDPIQRVDLKTLFTSLMLGYMANIFLPAHLGEFVRAFLVGKKQPVPAGAVFGTVVIERIIDVFTMLLLLVIAIMVFPFPDWVKKSGYISFAFILLLFVALVVMKKYQKRTLGMVETLLRFLPDHFSAKLKSLLCSFLEGIVPLKHRRDYIVVTILSIVIWLCYGLIFQIAFFAFDFVSFYALPWSAALIILVTTTFSVLVPSSPGYVGTYHYICQITLGWFGVPQSEALTFAFLVHGINFLPVLLLGLVLLSIEGMSLKNIESSARTSESVK